MSEFWGQMSLTFRTQDICFFKYLYKLDNIDNYTILYKIIPIRHTWFVISLVPILNMRSNIFVKSPNLTRLLWKGYDEKWEILTWSTIPSWNVNFFISVRLPDLKDAIAGLRQCDKQKLNTYTSMSLWDSDKTASWSILQGRKKKVYSQFPNLRFRQRITFTMTLKEKNKWIILI